MRRKTNILQRIDWITVLIYLILVFLGWINIYAAVYNEDHGSIFDISQRYGKQLIWIFASFVLIVVVFIFESQFYSVFAYIIYLFMILLLLAVLIFGKEVNGAKSWFEIGNFAIQPAEFAKFSTSLAIARMLSMYKFKVHNLRNLFLFALLAFFPAILIILQNDTGSALVYMSFIFVLYRFGLTPVVLIIGVALGFLFVLSFFVHITYMTIALSVFAYFIYIYINKNFKTIAISSGVFLFFLFVFLAIRELFLPQSSIILFYLLSLLVTLIVASLWAYLKRMYYIVYILVLLIGSISFVYSVDYIFNNVLEKHQQTRINVLLGFEQDIRGAGYNVHQSKIAIGSGGATGKGFLQGTQTKFDFVPEQSTDFIFCTVGEEWGFVGTTTVIALFIFLLLRILYIAERQKSTFTSIYAYCVASILFFHFAINIGMTIGLAPVIGIPLPFFSYGGSSLWGFTILLFILVKLDTNRTELI